jgi:hypothetical protein
MYVSLKVEGTAAGSPLKGPRRLSVKPKGIDSYSVRVKLLILGPRPLSMQLRNGSDYAK